MPGCLSCVQRDIAHLCRWGDERDEPLSKAAVRPANPDRHLELLMERDRRLATLFRTDRKAWAVQMNKHTRLLLPWSIVDDVVEYCLRELNPLMNMFNRVILRTELRELRGNLCGHVHGYGSSSTSGGILGSLDSAIVSDDTYDRNQVDRGPETFAQCGAHSSRGAEARSSFARGGASARRYAPVSNDLGNARQSTRFPVSYTHLTLPTICSV